MSEYIRRCPTCDRENAPDVMRCVCGALLAGVDLVRRGLPAPAPALSPAPVDHAATIVCPFDDCAQPNPAGSTLCLYCNRSLTAAPAPLPLTTPAQAQSLISLPAALKSRFRILHPLPVQGAEAELILVERLQPPLTCVAKIYRLGVQLRPDVLQRLAQVSFDHRVQILESGQSDGYAFELMEYCALGSLREQLPALGVERLREVVSQVAQALAAVHAAGLIHRDLKPDNILLRSLQPLDLVLTDFGVSSLLDATQRFTGAARTLTYAAPECLSGVIDGKADYWSLGMLLLEAIIGRHPFSGLSEAVILHHLTTRSMDLSAVHAPDWRKLLRGLLLRDPKQRWGGPELQRWLDGDPSLVEPTEASQVQGLAAPYHLGKETCHTLEQLAVALAKNWQLGLADMTNGLLLAWFRDVQKDQNAVRLLLDLRYGAQSTVDLQLLRLILYLAPGIPPVWCGDSIELPALLARANRALQGDQASALWLNQIHTHRVLEAYADAGNLPCADIVERWTHTCDQFDSAWKSALALLQAKAPARGPDDYPDFDQLMYGINGPRQPSLPKMHPRLLAIAYDANWAERLRQRLQAELTEMAVYCPWLMDLGDVHQMDAASLLVVEALLPEAKAIVERQIQANQRKQQADNDEYSALSEQLHTTLSQIQEICATGYAGNLDAALIASFDGYHDLTARIRSAGRTDPGWQRLRNEALRHETKVRQLQHLIDQWAAYLTVNRGWMDARVMVFFVLAMLILPTIFGPRVDYWIGALVLAIAVWRMSLGRSLLQRIRALAQEL